MPTSVVIKPSKTCVASSQYQQRIGEEALTNAMRGLIHETANKVEEEKKVKESTPLRVQPDRHSEKNRFCPL